MTDQGSYLRGSSKTGFTQYSTEDSDFKISLHKGTGIITSADLFYNKKAGAFDTTTVTKSVKAEFDIPDFNQRQPYSGEVQPSEVVEKDVGQMNSNEELMIEIVTGTAGKGERLSIDITFTTISGESANFNYDVMATQGSKVILDDKKVYDHDGTRAHMTAPLPFAASDSMAVDVKVIFNGYGLPGEDDLTGPTGQVATKQVVPEF